MNNIIDRKKTEEMIKEANAKKEALKKAMRTHKGDINSLSDEFLRLTKLVVALKSLLLMEAEQGGD